MGDPPRQGAQPYARQTIYLTLRSNSIKGFEGHYIKMSSQNIK